MDYFSDLLSQEIRRIVREEVKACLQEEDAKTNQKIAAALRMAADSIETGAKDTPSSILLNDFKNYEEGIPSANSPKKSEKMEEIDKSSVPDLAEEKKEAGGNSARGDPEPGKGPSASVLNHLPRLSGEDRKIDEIPLSDSPPRHFKEDRGMDEIEIEDLEEKEESFPMGTSDIDAGEKRGNSSEREADNEKISNEDVMKTLMEDMLAIVNEVPEKQDIALPDPYELKQKVVFDKIVPGDIIYCGLPKEDSVLSQMDPSHRVRIYVVISKHYDKLLCFYCSTKEKGDPELRITMDPNRCSTYQKGYMYLGKTQLVPSSEIISAVEKIKDVADVQEVNSLAVTISRLFNAEKIFAEILAGSDDSKLISSFKKNLTLLIQKTWVEKDDETVKEQVLYNLEQFCAYIEAGKYADEYSRFGHILSDVVYLMFGPTSKEPIFEEYSLRIDPEFGVFWWYIQNLPEKANFSEQKSRALLLLGMYFLANY